MKYLTISEIAQKWKISERRIQDLCRMERIPGVQRWGNAWMIPENAVKPADGRRKQSRTAVKPLLRKTPFLDMTDLYQVPGTADQCVAAIASNEEAKELFAAEIAYSRGDIDEVYRHATHFLENRNGLYAVMSGGMLLALCAMWKGDVTMWQQAKRHLFEAPWESEADQDVVLLALAATNLVVHDTTDFPDWFIHGCFDNLHADAQPAAWVYYIKYLMVQAQELAMGNIRFEGLQGLSLMKTLPYIIEPMITRLQADRVVMTELYMRLLAATIYQQIGKNQKATEHLDKAIALALPDRLFGTLAEHRRQLGMLFDERLGMADPAALKAVKELHKQLHSGWTKLHNTVLDRTVSEHLSPREREVARLASFGLTDQQIARQLYISEASVKVIIRSAKNKTGVYKRTELGCYV